MYSAYWASLIAQLVKNPPEWPNGFPYFLHFKSEFCDKELMIWATVSFRSCFCCVYRASPSSAAKDVINLISVLTSWWCPHIWICLLCHWKRVFAMTSAFSWQNSTRLCLLHSVLQGQICLLTQVFLDFLLLYSCLLYWKEHPLVVLVLEGLVGLYPTIQLQFIQITGWGIDLDYCDIVWFALEMNRDHSVIFEISSKYCILD